MVLSIATTHTPATDLGYLLRAGIWADQIAADFGYAADQPRRKR